MFAETYTIYVASAALWMQNISISDSKLFPKFNGQKTKKKKKKACLGGIKTYIVYVCIPRAAK